MEKNMEHDMDTHVSVLGFGFSLYAGAGRDVLKKGLGVGLSSGCNYWVAVKELKLSYHKGYI